MAALSYGGPSPWTSSELPTYTVESVRPPNRPPFAVTLLFYTSQRSRDFLRVGGQ